MTPDLAVDIELRCRAKTNPQGSNDMHIKAGLQKGTIVCPVEGTVGRVTVPEEAIVNSNWEIIYDAAKAKFPGACKLCGEKLKKYNFSLNFD